MDNSNGISPNVEQLNAYVSGINNLFFDTMFVMNIDDGTFTYFTSGSALSRYILTDSLPILDIMQLADSLRVEDKEKMANMLRLIKEKCNDLPYEDYNKIVFIADIKTRIGDIRHNTVTIKFTPSPVENGEKISYLIGCISISSNTRPDTLYMLNTDTLDRSCYDFMSRKWKNVSLSDFTEIERHVFFLSAEGLSIPEISDIVCRAADSVKSIRKRIFEKLGTDNITEAITFAITHKIF